MTHAAAARRAAAPPARRRARGASSRSGRPAARGGACRAVHGLALETEPWVAEEDDGSNAHDRRVYATNRPRPGRTGGRCRCCPARARSCRRSGLVLGRGRVLERGSGRRRVRASSRRRWRPRICPRPSSAGVPGISPRSSAARLFARSASFWLGVGRHVGRPLGEGPALIAATAVSSAALAATWRATGAAWVVTSLIIVSSW